MTLKTFFKLVEIQTKVASLFPFLVGLLFTLYRFDTFRPVNTIIFFIAMITFDLTTTAINNYMDYRKASSEEYRRERNIIGQKNIPERLVVLTIFGLLAFATALGIWLMFRTDLLVLFIGILCFAIGILYTFGPIPISRMPLGEVFSGVTMGFGIVYLTTYVNAFDKGIANFFWDGRTITFQADIFLILEIIWVSLPCVFTIANIMLANNICDLEDDIKNNRFTLPFYIGKKYALILFNILYILAFIAIVTTVIFDILPMILLVSLVVAIPVYQHVYKFNLKQLKSETFPLSVTNLVLVNGAFVAMLIVSIVV